ncbi:hypothetical protein CUJ84_pRLN1000725 (plasmid) [Rhizobium leguminosarum]|uniref:Uncharacterized protein n=2 Tax=Rhizobium leguminosarum TaxID=384 RepID=A0A2K9ZD86_RHILE|nr:hypothetical protein CUJ84_pRLN1000725 [Rhizobium leguminosarum]
MTAGVIFHVNKEMTMTNENAFNIECTIEELRLEAREAPTAEERRLIEAELEAARAELAKQTGEGLP